MVIDHILSTISSQRSFLPIDEEVVGFEEDAERIIQHLTRGTEELDIVSIVGMPGLGKTTLARKVFNHFIDYKRFDVRAWCSISKEYSLRKVFSKILKQALGSVDGIKDEDMPDKLRKSLMRKRYLIVLDDIWEDKAWEELRLSFPDDENGSRIVVTTRDEKVARQLMHHSNPYFLRFLTLDESWELLQKKVFQGEICPPELQKVGLQIARNCKGLPLVIVLIAGVIAETRQVSLWHEAANNLSSHALEEKSMKMIESSYDHLEDHLKPCLLYLALFPEDYRFTVSDLLNLWIAENFVSNTDRENMEEASKICLNDLVNRSLVMVSKWRDNGEIKYCTVHDVVREFCLRRLEKEKFMQPIVPYNPYQPLEAEEPRSCMYIHQDLVNQLVQYEYSLDKIPILGLKEGGSLEFIAHPVYNAWEGISFSPLPDTFRLIRVLHLLDIDLEISWDTAINAVTHLRYLAIRTQAFDFQWVSHLLDLQTLRVVRKESTTTYTVNPAKWGLGGVRCMQTLTLPLEGREAVSERDPQLRNWFVQKESDSKYFKTSPAIWKMQKLRHVDISEFFFKWEDNDRAIFKESSEVVLPNLKTFGKCCIYLADMTPEFWLRFPNIEELTLKFVEPKEAPGLDMLNLEELPLQSLKVEFSRLIGPYKSIGRGSWFIAPSNLKNLTLQDTFITEEMVANIARLQNLERLKLHWIYFEDTEYSFTDVGYSRCWDVSDYKFQALKYLKLQLVIITEWHSSESSFPELEKLVIKKCRFQEIPPSFVDVPTLKLIKVFGCNKSLVDSARNIKKEVEEMTGCDSLQVHAVRDDFMW